MTRRAVPSPNDLDALFAGRNAFASCSSADQQALRAVLDERSESLGIVVVGGGALLQAGVVPVGHLYCVLSGRISLRWTSEAGKGLIFLTCGTGEVFGEIQCGLFGRIPASLGLELAPAIVRGSRT